MYAKINGFTVYRSEADRVPGPGPGPGQNSHPRPPPAPAKKVDFAGDLAGDFCPEITIYFIKNALSFNKKCKKTLKNSPAAGILRYLIELLTINNNKW